MTSRTWIEVSLCWIAALLAIMVLEGRFYFELPRDQFECSSWVRMGDEETCIEYRRVGP